MLAGFGGLAGIRDPNAMQSALARPRKLSADQSADAAAIAAAYSYWLSRNYPSSDGNKPAAYALALVFLLDNGRSFVGSDVESVEAMLAVAAGTMSEPDLAAWFRARLRDR
jgi:death on curing protein